LIIGGRPGSSCALRSAHGLKVALVRRRSSWRVLHWGCIPTKLCTHDSPRSSGRRRPRWHRLCVPKLDHPASRRGKASRAPPSGSWTC
jgi:pyruvate/2-oxoglutarate dehydrogenase complex dihydrolipoamide dehydrogenase (E3) component